MPGAPRGRGCGGSLRAPRGSACVRRRVASAAAGAERGEGAAGGGSGRRGGKREGASSGGDVGTAVTSPRGLYSWGRVWVPRLVPAAARQHACGGRGAAGLCLSVSVCLSLSLSPSLPRIYGLYFLEGGAARMRVQLVCVVLLALASCSLCSGKSPPPPAPGAPRTARPRSPSDRSALSRSRSRDLKEGSEVASGSAGWVHYVPGS